MPRPGMQKGAAPSRNRALPDPPAMPGGAYAAFAIPRST
jgi:hypothetical protein